ncbi:ATP-grasp domain-containing protein [Nocardia sp. CDC186]|uniref:ATP-grasp domain-containing protein n=1 Tax=Nocardia implantans TaxID=3108168 RepID=A0ABU6B4A4_9NOCA|nr:MULTISPECIES: ATP-grasp domain-containing protein [unclassified Nocardia]MBF6196271.1 ATP-grasp domain-containing protein [Nocardia beijingensis]MEA3527765.1 ATP-grasp domain-containing protein [Nocardia sp. CDC192]MEB3514529.1 ATP-grasp domain-containing protein [Nocardia sp. CDC186]
MSDKSVLIVDPVSSGTLYPSLLEGYGIDTLLLDTDQALVSGFRRAPTPGALNFEADFGSSYRLLLRWCLDRSVKYVIAGSEPGVELCDRLRADLPDCPGNDTTAPTRRWDKQRMFEALAAAGVPSLTTRAVEAHGNAVPPEAIAELRAGRKLVVKPARGAASVDVRLVDTPDQLTAAVSAITGNAGLFGSGSAALIQQMYPAPRVEYAVDTFSTPDGHELVCVSVYDKWVSASGDFVYERGRWLEGDDPVVGELTDYACRVLDALGVRVGPAHMEIMSGALGPRLIDFGARAHGIGHPRQTYLLTGNSQIHRECEYIAELFGIRAPAPERRTGYALSQRGALVLFSIDHQARYLGGAEAELAGLPGVLEVRMAAERGRTYPATRSMMDSVALGLAFVVAGDMAELDFRCAEVRKRVRDFFTAA